MAAGVSIGALTALFFTNPCHSFQAFNYHRGDLEADLQAGCAGPAMK